MAEGSRCQDDAVVRTKQPSCPDSTPSSPRGGRQFAHSAHSTSATDDARHAEKGARISRTYRAASPESAHNRESLQCPQVPQDLFFRFADASLGRLRNVHRGKVLKNETMKEHARNDSEQQFATEAR